MKHYIEVRTVNKAKTDIDELFSRWGCHNLSPRINGSSAVARFAAKLTGVMRILTCAHKGDTLLLQYPMKKFYFTACTFAHWKGASVKTVVHDLGAFRRHKLTPEQENKRLSKTDVLIVHNETMEKWVIEHGFKGQTVCLHIFDYLIDEKPHDYAAPHSPWRIVYAGGLYKWRNAYLYNLQDCMAEWRLDLYGPGYEGDGSDDRIAYHGKLPEEKLMREVEGDFGLVWDGGSLDECTGDWGEYLKINNPHKTSFYLSAGLPVIVWRKAAMKDFVEKNNIGFSIDSIRDLDSRLKNMTKDEYNAMRDNACRMGTLLREGHFTAEAFGFSGNDDCE